VRFLAAAFVVLGGFAAAGGQAPAPSAADRAFDEFFAARTPQEAAALTPQIAASGIGFDEALSRLKRGRTYANDAPRGVVQQSYRGADGEFFYTLDVPEGYDPVHKYQVRVQLHGGVGRIETNVPPRPGSNGRLAGAEQIYVMPYAWKDAPWWSGRQIQNLSAILDRVKRTYNVDENRVVLSGVSDGGTGTYYVAMRDTTPFAAFVPLNGFIMVLENEMLDTDGDLFPGNLRNKPFFIVNGGRDPMYPTSLVDRYVDHLKTGGVDLVYQPQPNAAHDTSWWPVVKDPLERFVADHPRHPLPDALSWESGPPNVPSRAHWLIVDKLGGPQGDPALTDLNRMPARPALDFGIRVSGSRINRVLTGSNAEAMGLRSGDLVTGLNNQPIALGTDVAEVLRNFPPGRPLILNVTRGQETIRVTGRFAPTVLPGVADRLFSRQAESGRVDLVRTSNRIDAKTQGVSRFTLLLSPDQFDLSRPITVTVNGLTVFDALVRKDLQTLLEWAARDNDRTLLFAAELPIDVPK
jgi:hypothetical protein